VLTGSYKTQQVQAALKTQLLQLRAMPVAPTFWVGQLQQNANNKANALHTNCMKMKNVSLVI
jgi:hypothetical protein